MALTTTAELKTHLRISGASEDTFLDQVRLGVEAAVLRYLGRSIESAEATEYYDGSGRESLVLRRRPLTAIATLHLDQSGRYGQLSGAFASSTLLVEGTDYMLPRVDQTEGNGGRVLRINDVWPHVRGCIKVKYTAGYTAVPEDLKLAVLTLCAQVRAGCEKGGILAGETLGSYSYTLLQGGSERSIILARSLLSAYCEVG